MIGRRVGTVAEIVRPGDYCGPISGYTGEVRSAASIGADPFWHGYLDEGHSWRGVGEWG